ncbi:hypothetical protein KDW54_06825 [Burkholderia ambifaria]|uniref:hypothetical protein n=1 Tax=Burkholderia ambifaria TaxID=152480 RepID=UPI001B907DDA|nr:hypothetical protein [Burkholderia ambifaria]MBR8182109.1 hypothetical protein [Burkholderia ambifaria]
MNAEAVSDWALECAIYANASGMIDLPYCWAETEVDRLLALYASGTPPEIAARALFMRH